MKNTSPQGGQFEGLAGGSLEEGETGVCSSAVLILWENRQEDSWASPPVFVLAGHPSDGSY